MTSRTRLVESITMIQDRLSEEDKDLAKELIGWELGDSSVLLPPVLSVKVIWNNVLNEKCSPESLKTMARFHSKTMHRVSLSSSVSSTGREPSSKVKKRPTRF